MLAIMNKVFENIRDFLKNINDILIALLKVIMLSKLFVKLPTKKGNTIAVLANGPSLTKALVKIKKEGMPENIMVTNFFCNSPLFEELKPNNYIICDPLFKYKNFIGDNRIIEFYEKVFSTQWKINFFIPYSFKKDIKKISKVLSKNDNVTIYYYNGVNFNGNNAFLLFLMKLKLGIPRPTTVAVPAIMESINMGFKEIKIAGIDLNQHQDIRVNKENILELRSKHFYNEKEEVVYKPWMQNKKDTYKVSEIFTIFSRFFSSFDIVNSFAKKYKIEINNYSEESYLDQFKKI